jgi:hypothetical protein
MLFRMLELPRDDARRLLTRAQRQPIHRAPHCSGNKAHVSAAIFGICLMQLSYAAEPVAEKCVSYRGTAAADKMPPRFDFPQNHRGEIFR